MADPTPLAETDLTTTPRADSSRPSPLAPGQCAADARTPPAGGNQLRPGQREPDLQHGDARANDIADQNGHETHQLLVGTGPDQYLCGAQYAAVGSHLLVLADVLGDLEHARIAATGRLRALTDAKGLSAYVDGGRLGTLVAKLDGLESDCERQLRRTMRAHPLGPWVSSTVGLGEKQVGRLLAATGDPLWNADQGRPRRGVAEFWQYCGHGDPARSHCRKGKPVEHNPTAKMRTHLIAESCIKHRQSPYRPVYDAARAAWADRETTDMHKHNHALRLVGKAVLRDLWVAAREASSVHSSCEDHRTTG